ncbi:MAG: alpha-E domain-containing protein [Pseudomonadota bacterium]
MLSRVAERLYWMARYLERTECSARVCNAYSHLVLDLPKGEELGWQVLVNVIDGGNSFSQRYQRVDERNVMKFIILDKDNFGSIASSVTSARENLRTTRDALPADGWEHVNELYLFVQNMNDKSLSRRRRHEYLSDIIQRNQQINGLLASSVARDRAFTFLKLGQLIERLDMTSRVIDVACLAIAEKDSRAASVVPLLWASVLKAVSAHSAYRREVGPLIDADQVIEFVCLHSKFPRSLNYCLSSLEQVLSFLDNNKKSTTIVRQLRASIVNDTLAPDKLHGFIDNFQAELASLHDSITASWFGVSDLNQPAQKSLFTQ